MVTLTRIFDLLPYIQKTFKPKDDVLAGKENGQWVKYDIQKYREIANDISYALLQLGVQKGDKIITIISNCPEWNFIDMGMLQIGAVHVPVYPTISESEYLHILTHSDAKYVFVSGKELYRKIAHILPQIPNIEGVFSIKKIDDDIKQLSDLIELGKNNRQPERLEAIKQTIDTHDLATIIYTSGTMGPSKGVMLSHSNILNDVFGVRNNFALDEDSRAVSYLPLCHVYERENIYTFHLLGVAIYYAENLGTIIDVIQEVKPQIFTSVPRFLEKVYYKILSKGRKMNGLKKQIFFWADNLGKKHNEDGENSWWHNLQLFFANKLVFNKWREALGGKIRVIVVGGAAMQPRLIKLFCAAKMPINEGYGLTETSPVISVNCTIVKGGIRHGTVGRPLMNVEVKISEEGEILVKGLNVMLGYYKNPELTKQVIDKDGWFHTGDLGMIDKDGFVKITGRIKEIFKTSMGKYVSPILLENKFNESPFIDTIVAVGENQKFVAALIHPNFEHLRSWCKIKEIEYSSDDEMIKRKEIIARYKKEIDKFNQFFGDFEKIKKFELVSKEWTIQSGEMTASLKLKRKVIIDKNKDLIERIFAE